MAKTQGGCAVAKTLPKGHLSCLSDRFRYTPAHQTDVAQTLARIRRELADRAQPRLEPRRARAVAGTNLTLLSAPR
jgi:hypothetical protein